MQLEIRRIHERTGMTTVAVTHDQVEAMTMSDRVAILDGGRISQVGTPREVYRTPANLFVAGFLGEANLLEARDGAVPALRVATSGARDGTAVIRPEDLAIGGDGVAGTVDSVSFQGARQRVLVTLEGGERVVVSAPVGDGPGLAEGDAVTVRTSQPAAHAVEERTEQAGRPVVGAPA
jgi:putative spermidine/putrescine transport system ATP-binding protein